MQEMKVLHQLLDNIYKDLHKRGIGTKHVQSNMITAEEELLWSNGDPEIHK